MDQDQYKLGHTKVFFRAGVLGGLEELREERLSKILAYLQAHIRGYLMRKKHQKLLDQRLVFILYVCIFLFECSERTRTQGKTGH